MIIKLPIIGQIKIGSDAQATPIVEKAVSILGGFLEFGNRKLSDEKSISKKLLEANTEWVYRNNDVIAKEVANIEFKLYRLAIRKGEFVYEEVSQHPLLDLLDRFNASTTKSDAMYITQSHKKLTGDAFWQLDMNGNAIKNIFILPPDKITLKIGDPNDATDELIEGYEYRDMIDGKEIKAIYEPEEIIHFKTPNPRNPFRGYGAVEAAAQVIDIDNLTNITTRNFFEKGAITNFVLSTDAKLQDDQIKRLEAQLRSKHTGLDNSFKTMILGGGLKPEKISFSNKEMEFLAQLEWYRDKLMIIFGNTKASLGIIDDVNRASHESSIISWKRNSVKPDMQSICNTLNEFLVPRFGNNLLLGFEDPVPEDRSSKLEEVKILAVDGDIITADEAREVLGYDSINSDSTQNLKRDRQPTEVPEPLKQVDLSRVFRQRSFYQLREYQIQLKEAAKPIARAILKKRKQKSEQPVETREHAQFTNDKVWGYWEKQIHIVDVIEERFRNVVRQYIEDLEKTALSRVDEEVQAKKTAKVKALYNTDDQIVKAELDFTPILMEQVIASGQQAFKLIDLDDPYIPYQIRESVRANVRKFTSSMLDTDRDKLTDILASGIKEGKSVAEIRREMQEVFEGLKKNQAERITRTEVIKVSNMAAQDAWEQSGIVEAKQWLTAEDDRVEALCASMNGKVIGLKDKFFNKGEEYQGYTFDYESIKQPPLHPNCRCVLLPVVTNQKGYEPAPIMEKEALESRIKELESQIDKRTKSYKELKQQRLDDLEHMLQLEELLSGQD